MSLLFTRRSLLKLFGNTLVISAFKPALAFSKSEPLTIMKPTPKSGEKLPVIGMGTWRTFNVGRDQDLLQDRTRVLDTFLSLGGRVIDCSPMYGSSAATLGYALNQIKAPKDLFAAEKVWTGNDDETWKQIQLQRADWDIDQFDLMQVHNLLEWESHLPVLQQLKREGKIRCTGVTTSHGRRHKELEQIIRNEDIDFIQLTYNITHRAAEQRLLPLAQEKGIAVIANRPFDGGELARTLKAKQPLPEWASSECGCSNWPEFLLKFIVSHPAVTCAIPATTKVAHMHENMQAAQGDLPEPKQRMRMVKYIEAL